MTIYYIYKESSNGPNTRDTTMTYSTIYNFFYNGNHNMLIGLPVSTSSLNSHFTHYGNGVYEMSGFIHRGMEFITVTNGIVSHVSNNY